MSQNAVVSCNRRLLAPAIARTRLNIHLRSEDFVRIVLRGVHRLEENLGATDVELSAEDLQEIESAFSGIEVQGERYPEALQRLVGR